MDKKQEQMMKEKYADMYNYAFKEGDILYDNRAAYDLPWGQALQSIKTCLKVVSAIPASVVATKSYETREAVRYLEDKAEATEPSVISYQRTRIAPGKVVFDVMRPNASGSALEAAFAEPRSTTQEMFVYYLQTGVLILV